MWLRLGTHCIVRLRRPSAGGSRFLDDLLGQPPPEVGRPEFAEAEHEVRDRVARLLSAQGDRTGDDLHRQLGRICWDHCGMQRSRAGLELALQQLAQLRGEFWARVRVTGEDQSLNQALEKAGRVADSIELAELMCRDALQREESCGGHFRGEYQTEHGEVRRDDANFSHVAAWQYAGPGQPPLEHREPLEFQSVQPSQRSYE